MIRFISNSEFLTIECENVPFGSGGIDDKKRYREAIYQMEKGRVWENTTHYLRTQYEDSLYADAAVYENFQFDSEKKADVILVNLGTHLMIIDRNTYNILCEEDFSYPIVKLAVYNESTVLLGLADGSVERFWMDDRQKIFSAEDSSVGGFLYDANKKVIIQMKDGTPFLVISQIAQDTSMKPAEAQDKKKKIRSMCMTERRKSRFSRFPAMGQMNHWWHFLKKMNSWWYTATEKLRSGILLPEKISPHRWWIWILHRKQIFWQIRKADIWRCIQERAR